MGPTRPKPRSAGPALPPRATNRPEAVAARLVARAGGPRDVVEIHGLRLRRRDGRVLPQRAQAAVEEGGLLVLELMGHLASHFRRGFRPAPTVGRAHAGASREATG